MTTDKETTIKFEACPSCGSKNRIAESAAAEEIANGNLKVGTRIAVLISRTAVFDPADTTIIARRQIQILTGFYDVCAECGVLYCIEMQKGEGVAEPQVRKMPGGDGHMPFMG